MNIPAPDNIPRDLRLHKGDPHDFDLYLDWLFETAKSIGANLNRSAVMDGILSDSLYQKEQVKRHLIEETGRARHQQRYGGHSICGFRQDTAAYDLAKHFEDEMEERDYDY